MNDYFNLASPYKLCYECDIYIYCGWVGRIKGTAHAINTDNMLYINQGQGAYIHGIHNNTMLYML